MKKTFGATAITMLVTVLLDVINRWQVLFPDLEIPSWAYPIMTLAALYLPSIFGIAHRQAFNEAQAPGARTNQEIANSATAVALTKIQDTPQGEAVTIPRVEIARATGTKGANGE